VVAQHDHQHQHLYSKKKVHTNWQHIWILLRNIHTAFRQRVACQQQIRL